MLLTGYGLREWLTILVVSLLLALAAAWFGQWWAVGLVAIGAVIPGAFAGLLFARGLPLAGAARASVLTYLEPLVSVLIGATVWREGASLWTAAGSALLIAGGLIVSRGESAPK